MSVPYPTPEESLQNSIQECTTQVHARNPDKESISEYLLRWTPASAYICGQLQTDGCFHYTNIRYVQSNENQGATFLLCALLGLPAEKCRDEVQLNQKGVVTGTRRAVDVHFDIREVAARWMIKLKEDHVPGPGARRYTKCWDIRMPPTLPADLVHHYLRGFLDGDGGVSWYNNNGTPGQSVELVSNKFILDQIQDWLVDNANIFSNLYYGDQSTAIDPDPDNPRVVCRLKIRAKSSFCMFREFLYKDSEGLRLEAKYQKFQNLENVTQTQWDEYQKNKKAAVAHWIRHGVILLNNAPNKKEIRALNKEIKGLHKEGLVKKRAKRAEYEQLWYWLTKLKKHGIAVDVDAYNALVLEERAKALKGVDAEMEAREVDLIEQLEVVQERQSNMFKKRKLDCDEM
jgi:hypothetical protein